MGEEKIMEFKPLTCENQPKVRFLVVDDSVFARKNLCKMVQAFGGEIAGEAGDGVAAIAESASTHPDVVLLDITMHQMEGIGAVERIVLVYSVGYQDNILSALKKGARHFVQKPVKPEVLYEIIRYVLNDKAVEAPA